MNNSLKFIEFEEKDFKFYANRKREHELMLQDNQEYQKQEARENGM